MARRKIERRRVDYLSYDEDNECALLGALGFSGRYIERKTGLTLGKVEYRLRKAEIRRTDFRNGEGRWAKMMLSNMRDITQPRLTEYLRQFSPKPEEAIGRRR